MLHFFDVLLKRQPVEAEVDPIRRDINRARYRNRCALANFRATFHELFGEHDGHAKNTGEDHRAAPHS